MMKCQIISDLSVFEAMRGKWNDLAANFRSPLLSHEWVLAGIEAFCSKHCPPAVFVVQSGVELKAAAPLTIVCRGGVPQLEPVGACHLGEPCGFLYESDEALEALLKTILDFRHSFALLRFDIKAQELTALGKLRSKGSMHIYRSAESSLWAPLTSRWDDFEATISSGRRSDLRRYRRRAERLGEMKFEVLCPTVDTLAPYLEEFFQVEASGWKGRNGSAIISSPGTAEFFRRYAQKAAGLRMLRMFFLKIDGKTAAARMAVEYNRRLWDLKIAYDEAFSECSPGVLLTHETMRYAVDQGLEAYEFLGTAEPWERIWRCEESRYASAKVYPLSMGGGLSLLQDSCRFATARALKIMRERPLKTHRQLHGLRPRAEDLA